MIEIDQFEAWLNSYGRCWESGDSSAIKNLFTDDARYYETPFDEPMIGLEAISNYWRKGTQESQTSVRFTYSTVAVAKDKGLSRWSASFVRVPSGNKVELDAFLEAEFATDGRCSRFNEWWHRREFA
jgi:hypothetical protein